VGIARIPYTERIERGEIPAAQIWRMIRFDLEKVRLGDGEEAKAMPNSQCSKQRAIGGVSLWHAAKSPGRKTGF
jgi:hypothetical protein